jgi:sulfite oxidase
MWHHAIAGELNDVPEDSWKTVLKEKHPEMLHLLQFPYNGEPPKVSMPARLTNAITSI